MNTEKLELAVDFKNIERKAKGVEGAANGIFSTLKAEDVTDLGHFNELVAEAYKRNGWSQVTGRPAAGSKEKPAPDVVKFYVSTFRAAYRLKLDVLSFDHVGAMRTALRDKRGVHASAAPRPPELKGVQISAENRMNGALWHDAVVLHQHLAETDQQEFERELRMLMMRFTKAAPEELVQAA